MPKLFIVKSGINKLHAGGWCDVLSDDNIEKFSNRVPITIAPYISSNAEQYTSRLDKPAIILKTGNIKELKPRLFTRKVSTASAVSFGRRKSSIIDIDSPLEDNEFVKRVKKTSLNWWNLTKMCQEI